MFKHYSTKRALIDLLSIKEQVLSVYKDETKYRPILDYLFAKDYLEDDSLSIPSIKEIALKTDIKYSDVSKVIKELYYRLFDDDELNFMLDFKQTEVIFFLRYLENYAQVKFKSFTHLPRMGEQVSLDFAHAKVGTYMFYVERIEHTFENNLHRIYIRLRSGVYNSYLSYRRYRATEEGEISHNDFYDMTDYQLKEALKIGRY